MRFASVCSGIEAASEAWHSLGWSCAFVSEIEPFACALLEQRWSAVPNLGDMNGFAAWPDAAFDVLVGGTPCQSFSVAGLRAGLADPRGNLTLVFLAVVERYCPRWVVWENVPGLLSTDGGRAFGSFLAGLGQLGYGFAYRILDAQYFGVAQRRRRVFVVGHLGNWRRAATVLFERESLRGNPAPRREAGKRIAPTVEARADAGGAGWGTDFLAGGGITCTEEGIAGTVSSKWAKGTGGPAGDEHYNLLAFESRFARNGRGAPDELVPPLKAQSGTSGRGDSAPLIAFEITHRDNRSDPQPGDPCHTLPAKGYAPAIAFKPGQSEDAGAFFATEEYAPTLQAMNNGSTAVPAVAFAELADPVAANQARTYTREGTHNFRVSNVAMALNISGGRKRADCPAGGFYVNEVDTARALDSGGLDSAQGGTAVMSAMRVRRLTPRECERLQGFPDDYTLITYRGSLAKDGPRYRALGNSMAVPVMQWIGKRIELAEAAQ